MVYPELSRIKAIAQSGEFKTVPLSMEILSDIKTPIEVLRILKNISNHCYMLESISDAQNWGRYTFLGYDPKLEVTCVNGRMKIGDRVFETTDPGKHISQILESHKSARLPGLPPFTGGLVGYFAYDYIKYAESSLNLEAKDTEGFKDVDLMLFDKVIAFDNFAQKIILIVNIDLENYEEEYNRGVSELGKMTELIKCGFPHKDTPGRLKSEITALFDKSEYCRMVEQGKHHIKEGDVLQIVLSNRLEAEYEGTLFNTYRLLRTLNPSPYMFYFSSDDIEIAGASPETLIKLKDGVLRTYPLAGTRPRGRTEEEDKRLEEELLSDPKELSEHDMLVTLGMEDIGKISRPGSITVEKHHIISRYSHVMHIESIIRGEIQEGKTALDAIDAILPAGTLSGAPKIKACQLINNIENNKRGIYGGAIGYLDLTGNMDTCIAIRIAYKKNGKVFVRSGAGIVADSVPEKEYQECLNKAEAVVKALKMADEIRY